MSLCRQDQLTLLAQARGGSGQAMHQLLTDFREPALALIRRTLAAADVGPGHDEDALGQAMLKFQQVGIRRFSGRSAPRTYFVRMAINCAIDVARRQSRLVPLEAEPADVSFDELLADRKAEAHSERMVAILRRCVRRLDPVYRRPVQLYYLRQAGTCERCAKLMGIKKPAFMQRLSRARKRLARMVSDELQQGRRAA